MVTESIIAIIAALLSILMALMSYNKIRKQTKQERELLSMLENKSSEYLKNLIKHLEDGGSIETIQEIEGHLTKSEMEIRDRLFEKHILDIIKGNEKTNFSEVKNALYSDGKINRNYLEKIHNNLSKISKYRTTSDDKDLDINNLIFQIEELKTINQNLERRLKILSDRNYNYEGKIEIKLRDKFLLLNLNEITHITAEDGGCRIVTVKNRYWADYPLKHFANLLPKNFVRIHRPTIININYVEWINHMSLRLSDGNEFKVGRTYKKELLDSFNLMK